MTSEILSTLDAMAVATFIDIGKQVDNNGDARRAESYYLRALRAAETIYGWCHGETGLVLMRLVAFYRRHDRYDDVRQTERRISEIIAMYKYDLES